MSVLPSRRFTVGLLDVSESNLESRALRRVVISAEILKGAKVFAGDVVAFSPADVSATDKAFAVGVAWPSLELSQDSVLVTIPLLRTARTVEGAQVHLFPLSGSGSVKLPPWIPPLRQVQEAGTIHLKEIFQDGTPPFNLASKLRVENKRKDWLTLAIKELMVDLKYLTNTQSVELVYEGKTRHFRLVSVSQHTASDATNTDITTGLSMLSIDERPQIWTVGWDTVVSILHNNACPDDVRADVETIQPNPLSAYAAVGGLDKQISQIRDLLEIPLTRPDLFRHLGLKPPRGILLHGPPGTGKTHLARAIASSTKSSVLIVNGPELSSAYHGETESKLRDVFKEAHEKSPCIVVLDEVDALVPRREDGAGGEVEKRVVATLLTVLDGMDVDDPGQDHAKSRVVVIGTTNRPNSIDPALRRPGRFDREIEIGIPDADARFSILQVLLSKAPHSIPIEDIRDIAARAYGYVGADLSAVVREAGTLAIKRYLSQAPTASPEVQPTLTLNDLLASLPTIRPSAMRSLFLDTPPVRYADIGGQATVIQKLRETVEWPLLHPEAFKRLGVRPPKGVLLYGPPGCSKTILVRACACESGINFIAVKGPELLNKFLGESERAVREIFRKARAASPSIIFFDEIDALGTTRSSADSESGSVSHEGVLTSLLNEMDGVQELVGVTVVAATNRPEVIDSALLRSGRLDRALYVGPPDQGGREEILKIRMSTMSVEPGIDVEAIARMTDGCSGAEIAALCQEAALLTMQEDMNAPFVPLSGFTTAAKAMKRQITPEVIKRFEKWRDGVQ